MPAGSGLIPVENSGKANEFCREDCGPAEADPLRLFDHLLERADTAEDFLRAQGVLDALRVAILSHLATMHWSFRKAGDGSSATRRELIVPAGATGCVALYEIESPSCVVVLAVRHQLEDDHY